LSGLATRYDKTATIHLTGLHLAAIFITLFGDLRPIVVDEDNACRRRWHRAS